MPVFTEATCPGYVEDTTVRRTRLGDRQCRRCHYPAEWGHPRGPAPTLILTARDVLDAWEHFNADSYPSPEARRHIGLAMKALAVAVAVEGKAEATRGT